MKIKVVVQRENKSYDLDVNSVNDVFKELKINENEVFIVRNDEVITKDTKIDEDDKLELFSVISGG
tara:strand:- start:33892 stop:34089 length:198 start_codon:yes stop_codon:yes gene_type:complete